MIGGVPDAGSKVDATMRCGTAAFTVRAATVWESRLAGGMQPMQTCATAAWSPWRGGVCGRCAIGAVACVIGASWQAGVAAIDGMAKAASSSARINRTNTGGDVRPASPGGKRYTLKRNSITSPSCTTYSLPSCRNLPASRAPVSPFNVT